MSIATRAGEIVRPIPAVPDLSFDTLALLAQADEVLEAFPDGRTIARALATLVVPAFADWCATYLLGAGGAERVMLLHADPGQQLRLEAAFASQDAVEHDAAWRAGLVVQPLAPPADAGPWRELACALHAQLGAQDWFVVPLAARGLVTGCLVVGGAPARGLAEPPALVREIARRAGLAIEHAHARRDAERRAHEAADAAARQRQAEHELREAARGRDQFVAMLAHELRGPLAPIHYAVHMLHVKTPLDPELRGARDMLDRQVRHLSRLVDDLLDVSRITQQRFELRREPVDLGATVRSAVAACRQAIDTAQHELVLRFPAEVLWVDGDRMRLVQAFTNLLTNAVQYTPCRGRLGVTAALEDRTAVVTVSDNGNGIESGRLGNIFDVFACGDGTARSRAGIGVGLSLVRAIVELHGGLVAACSAGPGAGSEFTVRLPVLLAGSREPLLAGPARAVTVRRRVLVVDDNRDSADGLAALLEVRGHDVHLARDGEGAFAAADSARPDVVFLDIGLPGIDGCEVARRIRGTSWGDAMMLVAITGWGEPGDRERSLDAGFDLHLVKPVPFERLERLLESLDDPEIEV